MPSSRRTVVRRVVGTLAPSECIYVLTFVPSPASLLVSCTSVFHPNGHRTGRPRIPSSSTINVWASFSSIRPSDGRCWPHDIRLKTCSITGRPARPAHAPAACINQSNSERTFRLDDLPLSSESRRSALFALDLLPASAGSNWATESLQRTCNVRRAWTSEREQRVENAKRLYTLWTERAFYSLPLSLLVVLTYIAPLTRHG